MSFGYCENIIPAITSVLLKNAQACVILTVPNQFHTGYLCLDFQQLRIYYSLSQPHHVTASHSSPGYNHQSKGRRSERTQGKASKCPRETHFVTYASGLPTLSYLSHIVAQPPPSFLCCSRPPSHHPSSLTSVSLIPALHLLPPSTPF